eukprot:scaffold261396_cov35-Tisochrysis_lutea.AAC.1
MDASKSGGMSTSCGVVACAAFSMLQRLKGLSLVACCHGCSPASSINTSTGAETDKQAESGIGSRCDGGVIMRSPIMGVL